MRRRKAVFRPGFEPFSSWLAFRSTSRCAVSCSCLTLLTSPDSASGGLGRARGVSHGTCFTRVFSRISCLLSQARIFVLTALRALPSTSLYEMLSL